MIRESIKNFPEQLRYEPEVKNGENIETCDAFTIGGMGGSGLIAGVVRALDPKLDIVAHHEYGLPTFLKDDSEDRLFIAISYSGNTEETVTFLEEAVKEDLPTAVISTGGKLLEIAKDNEIPYIELPNEGIQPRMALGYILRSTLKLMGEEELFKATEKLAESFNPEQFEKRGKELAKTLEGKVPVIYSSRKNQSLAYNWKIKFNETGKIPAFYNTFPELNHNEMTGFDVIDSTRELSEKTHFIILKDKEDHERIQKRMEALTDLYKKRGLGVTTIEIEGDNRIERIFNTLTIADWTALYTAESYGVEAEQVPMVEEFKKLI